uniref:Uncharacterized protein n=1 Tax=Mantoniella antarctica TaxID=81844 RepID=A0A7S0SKG5_9CHLO
MAHVRATSWALVLVLLLTDAAALKAEDPLMGKNPRSIVGNERGATAHATRNSPGERAAIQLHDVDENGNVKPTIHFKRNKAVSNEVAHVPEGFKLGTASQVRTAEAQFKARARGQEREQIQLEQTHSGYVPGTAKYFRGNTAPLEAIRPQAKRLFTQRLGDSAPLATRVAAVRPATKGAEKMYSQGGGVTSFGRAIAK